jgi:hypothetical protein
LLHAFNGGVFQAGGVDEVLPDEVHYQYVGFY